MPSIIDINNYIQEKLKEMQVNELSAIEMAKILDSEGLLKDSPHRPGLPLRNYLRAGRIEGSYQYPNKRWAIRPIKREMKLTVRQAAEKLAITEEALYKRIERGSIVPEKIGERISIPISELDNTSDENFISEDEDIEELVNKELEGIYFEIENLSKRLNSLENKIKLVFKNKSERKAE